MVSVADRAKRATRVPPVRSVLLAKWVLVDSVDQLAAKDQPDLRAYPARKVPKAPKEWKAHSALMANLVHRVLRAHRDLLVKWVEWDHQECRDLQVNPVCPA